MHDGIDNTPGSATEVRNLVLAIRDQFELSDWVIFLLNYFLFIFRKLTNNIKLKKQSHYLFQVGILDEIQ